MSRESYIAGFAKVAEAHGIDAAALMKIAQLGAISDGYFKYNPNKVDDIFFELDPELEQRMSDMSSSSQPATKQPTTWRKYVPEDSGKMPVRTRAPLVSDPDPEALWARLRTRTNALKTAKPPATNAAKGVKGVNPRPVIPWIKRVGSILKKAR